MAPVGIHDIAPKRNHKRTEGQERRMKQWIDGFVIGLPLGIVIMGIAWLLS